MTCLICPHNVWPSFFHHKSRDCLYYTFHHVDVPRESQLLRMFIMHVVYLVTSGKNNKNVSYYETMAEKKAKKATYPTSAAYTVDREIFVVKNVVVARDHDNYFTAKKSNRISLRSSNVDTCDMLRVV